MDTETKLSGFGLSLLGAFLILAIAFAGRESIGDRSGAATVAPPDARAISRIAPADPIPEGKASNLAMGAAARSKAPNGSAIRAKLHCAGCGVVESMRRIEHRETAGGVCYAMDSERLWMPHNAGDRLHAAAFSPVRANVFTGHRGTRMPRVHSTYQIVVRFRDGSRHVFNEPTPRTLQLGEPVQVIAGADLPANDQP